MSGSVDRRSFIQLAAGTAAILASSPLMAAPSSIAIPRIEGPLPVTPKTDEPYRGENEQPVAGPGLPPPVLIPYGYVEEEYFLTGEVDGKPYKVSMLVRKPSDPTKFSGLVAVETIHNAGAIPFWGNKEVWLTGGHGWVAVSSQLAAMEDRVKKANPARYSSLTLPDAGEPRTGPNLRSGNPFGPSAQDLISQAIMTQIGAMLKANLRDGPFGDLAVRYLVMGGASQTGGTTLRYIAQSHDSARLTNGKAIYDGYLPMLAPSETVLRKIDSVIVHPVTEGDLMFFGALGRRPVIRPDGDGRNDRYRYYEIAAGSHVGTRGITDPLTVFSTLSNGFKPGERLSQFPMTEVMRAIVSNFVDWVMKGTAPPRAPAIERVGAEIVRDEHGNAKGGLRSPYVDTPTVRYIASAPISAQDNPFRRLIGLEEPIAAETLRSLYGSRGAYLKRFDAGIDAMVADRKLWPADGTKLTVDEAKRELF